MLRLPKRQQEELAELLRDVSLSSIISSAKIVADRLKFLTGIEAVLFDPEPKKRLKERSQLHHRRPELLDVRRGLHAVGR